MWTEKWIRELLMIAKSPELQAIELHRVQDGWDGLDYWLGHYMITQDEHDSTNPFKPFPYDDKPYLRELAYFWYFKAQQDPMFVLKSRQIMCSWLFMGCLTWDCMCLRGRRNAVQSKKEKDADALLSRAWVIYQNQPFWLKQQGVVRTYCQITFPQRKSVFDALAQGPDQVRQYVYSNLFSDEIGFQQMAEQAYMAALPSIKGGGRYVAVSTANSGFFQQVVCEGENEG